MTTKEEEPKEVQEGENEHQEEEEEKEEEEPVDLELQKEMKGLTISDSDFKKEPKAKKTQKKPKDPTTKKNKKKGQDFLDYANQNNIQINLEYEENKYQLKKTEDPKIGEKNKKNCSNNNLPNSLLNQKSDEKNSTISENNYKGNITPFHYKNRAIDFTKMRSRKAFITKSPFQIPDFGCYEPKYNLIEKRQYDIFFDKKAKK